MIIDLSHHQKDFPFDKAAAEVDFWIVRPSHGKNDTDREWADNLAWLKANPKEPFAVYHYFYYGTAAEHNLEMENFVKHVMPLKNLPNFTGYAFLDFEHTADTSFRPISQVTPREMTNWLISDAAVLKNRGFTAGIYASRSWLVGKMKPDSFPDDCIVWVAHYTGVPLKTDYPFKYDLHQYTSQGSLKSTTYHSGALDLDAINPMTKFTRLKAIINKPLLRYKIGDKGEAVGEIQFILNQLQYDLRKDSDFGPQTFSAVKEFQKDHGLTVDGIVGPQTWLYLHQVRTFSLKADGDKLVRDDCPSFRVREFKCKDGSDLILINLMQVGRAQQIRNHFKSPVEIMSAYRTAAHNKSQGGASTSLHLSGNALDIKVKDHSPAEINAYIRANFRGGIHQYSWGNHLDWGRNRSW